MDTSEKVLLYYNLTKSKGKEIDQLLTTCWETGVSGICLNQLESGFTVEELYGIASFVSGKMDLIVLINAPDCERTDQSKLGMSTLIEDLADMRKRIANLKIAGNAKNLAEAKNWDLELVDSIQFQLTDGNNALEEIQILAPKVETYGWSLLTLNKPLMVSGLSYFSQIESLIKTVRFQGLVISDDFELNSNRDHCIRKLIAILP